MSIEKIVEALKARKAERSGGEKPKTKRKAIKEIEERAESLEEELAAEKIRSALYHKLIERYAEVINLEEEKTIPELRALIALNDEAVQEVRQRILEEIKNSEAEEFIEEEPTRYDAEKDFPAYCAKAFEIVSSLKPIHANLSVSYWLSPREILELGAADALDKAIFLCSLLRAGECKNARVRVVEVEGGIKHAIVLIKGGERVTLLDPSNKNKACRRIECINEDETIANYEYGGKRVTRSLYEFNDEEYTEFEEE